MMLAFKNELLASLEREFGLIDTGMKSRENENVQIILYAKEAQSPSFISTLGLSSVVQPKFEWFMEFSPELSANSAASVLDHYLSLYLSGKLSAPKRGSYVLFPHADDRIWKGDNSSGLYFSLPVFRSHNFRNQMSSLGVIPAWVLPITRSEVNILDTEGWRALEDYWDSNEFDLHSPYRI